LSIQKNFAIFNKHSFVKDSLILTSGTVVAQIIPLIFYPLLTRLYLPSDFGIFATVASITSILSVVGSGQYESVILIADTKRIAANIIWLTMIISFLTLSLFEILFYFSSGLITQLFDIPSLKYWIYFSPPTAFLIIILASYNEWYVKNKYFVSLSINKVINTSSTTISKAVFGWTKIFSGGLIIGEFFGRLITAFVIVKYALKRDKESFSIPSLQQMKWLAKRYLNAP